MRCGARTVFQRDWRVEAAEVVCAPAVAVAEDDVVVVGALMLAAGCAEDVRFVNLAISIESRLRDADVAAGLVQHAQAVADAQLRGKQRGSLCVSRGAGEATAAGGARLGLEDAAARCGQLRLGAQLFAAACAGGA